MEMRTCPSSRLAAIYLDRFEGGREGILQGTAGKPPHLLCEHRACCHEHIPAQSTKDKTFESADFVLSPKK